MSFPACMPVFLFSKGRPTSRRIATSVQARDRSENQISTRPNRFTYRTRSITKFLSLKARCSRRGRGPPNRHHHSGRACSFKKVNLKNNKIFRLTIGLVLRVRTSLTLATRMSQLSLQSRVIKVFNLSLFRI